MQYIHNLPVQKSKELLLKGLKESSFSEKNKNFLAEKIRQGKIQTKLLDALIRFNNALQASELKVTKAMIKRHIKSFEAREKEVESFRKAEYLDEETLHRPMTI